MRVTAIVFRHVRPSSRTLNCASFKPVVDQATFKSWYRPSSPLQKFSLDSLALRDTGLSSPMPVGTESLEDAAATCIATERHADEATTNLDLDLSLFAAQYAQM